MSEEKYDMEKALDGILKEKLGYGEFCRWCRDHPDLPPPMNLNMILDILQQAYQAGVRQGGQVEHPSQKEEDLARVYVLDFSQARTWPPGLTEDLIGDALAPGEFEVEAYDENAPLLRNHIVSIEGGHLVLHGPTNTFSADIVTIKINKQYEDGFNGHRSYTITAEPDNPAKFRELKSVLESYGVRFVAQ